MKKNIVIGCRGRELDNTHYRIKPEWANVLMLLMAGDEGIDELWKYYNTDNVEDLDAWYDAVGGWIKHWTNLNSIERAFANDHDGDCVCSPMTCFRCVMEIHVGHIKRLFNVNDEDIFEAFDNDNVV